MAINLSEYIATENDSEVNLFLCKMLAANVGVLKVIVL